MILHVTSTTKTSIWRLHIPKTSVCITYRLGSRSTSQATWGQAYKWVTTTNRIDTAQTLLSCKERTFRPMQTCIAYIYTCSVNSQHFNHLLHTTSHQEDLESHTHMLEYSVHYVSISGPHNLKSCMKPPTSTCYTPEHIKYERGGLYNYIRMRSCNAIANLVIICTKSIKT